MAFKQGGNKMANTNKDEKFLACLNTISGNLDKGKELVNNDVLVDLQAKVQNLHENMDDIKKEERVLKIGIVGEVKAGKSSFLNALVFEGDTILPKAPTPMTAALTKLGYSEKPYAKIVFYTDYDWDIIEKNSSEYDEFISRKVDHEVEIYSNKMSAGCLTSSMPNFETVEAKYKNEAPLQFSACKELTRMVDRNGIDLGKYLNTTKEIVGKKSSEYMDELTNYVGAKGKFTPIVKHTELYIDNPLLKDIEIVDTPGLNDPILSRSETTKKFLINCDVAFLLSYVGQFLSDEDIQFLMKSLPREGIRKAVLIGSKFDSGMLDFNARKTTFMKAFKGSLKNYNSQAENNIKDCVSGSNCPAVMYEIQKSLPPKYISSLMYSASKKKQKNEELNEEEANIIAQFNSRFQGFDDSHKNLMDFSNILNIKDEIFTEIRNNKEKIISERIETLTRSQTANIVSILEDININARNNLSDLKKYDCGQLREKLNNLTHKLNSIRSEVKNLFEMSSINARKILNELSIEIEAEIDNYTNISVKSRSETKRKTERTGLFGWRKENYNITITTKSADIHEVISNIRKYANRVKGKINEEFDRLFDVGSLKRNVKNTIVGAFDLSDKNFNENDILVPLEIVLKKISIPHIDIDLEDYDEEIIRQFSSGVAEGQKISELILLQEKVMQSMSNDIMKDVLKTGDIIENMLIEQAGVFVDNIEKQLSSNVEILENKLNDKENSILEYDKFIADIAVYKSEVIKYK